MCEKPAPIDHRRRRLRPFRYLAASARRPLYLVVLTRNATNSSGRDRISQACEKLFFVPRQCTACAQKTASSPQVVHRDRPKGGALNLYLFDPGFQYTPLPCHSEE